MKRNKLRDETINQLMILDQKVRQYSDDITTYKDNDAMLKIYLTKLVKANKELELCDNKTSKQI